MDNGSGTVAAPPRNNLGRAAPEEPLKIDQAENGPGLRYFVKRGALTWYHKGFKSMRAASTWIDSHGRDVEWRVGYLFRIRGDGRDVQIVNRQGG